MGKNKPVTAACLLVDDFSAYHKIDDYTDERNQKNERRTRTIKAKDRCSVSFTI